MLDNKDTYKYDTLYNMPFETTQYWTNGTVTLQMFVTKISYNICRIKPYKYKTNVDKCPSIITSYIPPHIYSYTCLENFIII